MISPFHSRPTRRPGTENDPPSDANSHVTEVCHSTLEPFKLNDSRCRRGLHIPGTISTAEAASKVSNGLHQPEQDQENLTVNSDTTPAAKRDARIVTTHRTAPTDPSPSLFRSLANSYEDSSTSMETVLPENLESPVPESLNDSNHHPLLLYLSSSSSSSFDTDTNTSTDFSLTPPGSSPRQPLAVSAKRNGYEVQQQNSKRRRHRRRRPTSGESLPRVQNPNGELNNIGDDVRFWFWRDDDLSDVSGGSDGDASPSSTGSSSAMIDSSDEDEPYNHTMPFLFNTKEVSSAEANKQYWEWCYGRGTSVQLPLNAGAFSAARVPPLKGCLSRSRRQQHDSSPRTAFQTPPSSPDESEVSVMVKSRDGTIPKKGHRVQFGSPSAVEYHVDEPTAQLTPMPSEITRKRYSMNPKEDSKEEEELTHETKQNNAILMEWETQFLDNIGDETTPDNNPKRRARSSISRSNSIRRQHRASRRSSSIFSPLILSGDDDDDDETTGDDSSSCSTVETQHRSSFVIASPAEASPSVLVAQSLASLRMSTNLSSDTADDLSVGELSDRNESSHLIASTAKREANTWEFAVNLGSVHVVGGAMETSPTPSSPSTLLPTIASSAGPMLCDEPTPPPANVNMEAIHRVGGALDDENDDNAFTPSKKTSRNRMDTPQSPLLETNSRRVEYPHDDIVRTLLDVPLQDQEWGFLEILRSSSTFFSRAGTSDLNIIVQGMDSRMDGLLSCTDALMEKAKNASHPKKFPAKDSVGWNKETAMNRINHDWKELEAEFLAALIQDLNCSIVAVEQVVAEARSILPFLATKESSCVGRRKRKGMVREQVSLRKDLSLLQLEIARERQQLDLWEASSAPLSVILCQVSEHLSLCGFYLEQFDDDKLIVRFHHACLDDTQTRVVFTITTNKPTKVAIEPLYSCMKQDLQFIECHKGFMRMLADGMIPLTDEIRDLELQEATIQLSRWLAKLDLIIADLKSVVDECKVVVEYDLPTIALTMANGTVLHVTLDPCNNFRTREVILYRLGLDTEELSCAVGKSLVDIVSSIHD